MLVKRLMKVLKNLFGNNSKINASEIAHKDNNNVDTLDNIINNLNGNILYDNNSPNRGDVPLKDDYTNYKYLEIIGMGADGGMVSVKVKVSKLQNGGTINLIGTSMRDNQSTLCFWVSTLSANGKNLTPLSNKWIYLTGSAQGISDGNYLGVLTVIGYK